MTRVWRHIRGLWPGWTILAPVPFLADSCWAFGRGDGHWENVVSAFLVLGLAAGYGYRDWPREFVSDTLPAVAESFRQREDAPAVALTVTGESQTYQLGPPGAASPLQVRGAPGNVLAWLLGRHDGEGLEVQPGSSLPVLPPFR